MSPCWLRVSLAAAAAAATAALPPPDGLPAAFQAWALEHGRSYPTEEAWRKALAAYQKNEQWIQQLNADPEDGAEYGHTQFSDLTPEEFRELYLPRTLDVKEARRGGEPPVAPQPGAADPPPAVDWRDQGAVTPVRDQKACGSCWAESAVANIESQWYLANKATMQAPVPLSVQQVVECDPHDFACYGGFPKGAFQYVIEHGGIASEADYKYNTDGHTVCLANQTFNETCGDGMCDDPPLTNFCDLACSDSKHQSVASIASWQALPTDEDAIAAYVAEHGPVSVGLDASGSAGLMFPWLQLYKGGVANPKLCEDKVDHGVLVVGYGIDGGNKYWTIKNSWGASWGEAGYFRLIRGAGKCAVNTMVSTAIVRSAGDAVVV